ncbi:MAG TPA: hypothetical protein VFS46_01955 [Nitrososphaera sp.]|nr:hypothetical protein [Nitrososphaera sp.]
MGVVTWVAIAVIVLVAIGLGVGVFFSGLIRGAELIGQNPTVQNASEEAQEFVTDRTEIDGTDVLVITTDEATYSVGEPVIVTVRNIGDQTLTFPDSALGLEIQHVDSGQRYSVAAAQVITDLPPDESKEITWDEDAPAGDYTATVHTTAEQNVSAQVSFKITG